VGGEPKPIGGIGLLLKLGGSGWGTGLGEGGGDVGIEAFDDDRHLRTFIGSLGGRLRSFINRGTERRGNERSMLRKLEGEP
jgi:hypothetical protein